MPQFKRKRGGLVRSASHACALLSVLLSTNCGFVLAQDEPQLKLDTPRLDNTVPKSTLLRGGVKHEEANQGKAKLQGAANNAQLNGANKKFGLFGGKAKADRPKQLNSGLRDQSLNAAAQSGIGIIGVKFVLAFGRPPVINRVFPGTPAWELGLHNNDVIVAVDGVPTLGLTKEEVYQMIVGVPGSPVTVTISRNGDYLPRTMTRMDFNDITDPIVRRDYLMSM